MVNTKQIIPVLISMVPAEKYSDSSGRLGTPGSRWAVDYLVTLGDKTDLARVKDLSPLKRAWHKILLPRDFNLGGSLGFEFYFLVCSPEYAKQPDKGRHDPTEVKRAHIQHELNEEEAKRHLIHELEAVGEQAPDSLKTRLATFLDVSDWNEYEQDVARRNKTT